MQAIPEFFFPILTNLVRYFLFAGLAFVVFYRLFPQYFSLNRIQQRLAERKDFLREIGHSVQSSIIIGGVIAFFFFGPLHEYTQIYKNSNEYSIWWLPLSILIALVIHDTYFYWMHRTVHHPKLYRLIHLVHHKSVTPSPWASFSFHFTEAFIEALVVPFIVFLIPMHPISLIVFGLISFLFNVYGHLGYEVAPRWFRRTWLFEILNTSVYHNMHHEKFHGNYSLYFRWWDRLLGTENPDYVKAYDRIQAKRFPNKKPTNWPIKAAAMLGLLIMADLGLSIAAQPSLTGHWYDAEQGITIDIQTENGQLMGWVIAIDDVADNERLQTYRAAGNRLQILSGFMAEEDGSFCCGTIRLPRRKKELEASLRLQAANRLEIEGRYGLLTGKQYWERR